MSKIVTVTFSPCIDKSTTIEALIPEKKLRCSTPKLEPGGGGINVARAIKKLGGEAIAVFPSGGYTGKFFNHLLEMENTPSVIVETTQETRENIIIVDKATNNQYRFGMPGTALSESEWKQCLRSVEEMNDVQYIVASGSLPPGVPLNIYAQLARIAKKATARLIVDTSGEALNEAVDEGVFLLKPNIGELSSLVGAKKINEGEVETIARQLIQNSRNEVIVVSLGKSGAILVTEHETFRAKTPDIPRKSTVGAGDSMVAGIVFSLWNGWSLEQALQYGVACGTAATMNEGTELCKKEDANYLFGLISK